MIGVTVLCLALGCPWYSEQQLFRVSPNLITNSIIPAHNLIKSFEQFGSWFMEFLHSKGWYAPFQVRLRANRSWGKYVGLANLNTLLLVQLCDCSPSCRICLAWNHQLFLHPLFFLWKIPILSKNGDHIEATPTSPTWGLVRTQGFTEEEMDKMAVGDWDPGYLKG